MTAERRRAVEDPAVLARAAAIVRRALDRQRQEEAEREITDTVSTEAAR